MVDLEQQRNRVCTCLETSAHYQNSSDMRIFRAGQLYFNHDVFFCAMGAVNYILIEKKKKFYLR